MGETEIELGGGEIGGRPQERMSRKKEPYSMSGMSSQQA